MIGFPYCGILIGSSRQRVIASYREVEIHISGKAHIADLSGPPLKETVCRRIPKHGEAWIGVSLLVV